MQNLLSIQDEITIYQAGFENDDLLDRAESGKRLSNLLEKFEGPIVVALDGPWGSGKSHFLKRWVGAHKLENGGRATTVYLDAFESDFMDDPLIALTGAIGERLDKDGQGVKWNNARKAVTNLVRPIIRVTAAVATAGISEMVGPVADAAIGATAKEATNSTEAFWKKEESRKSAMLSFRDTLRKLTEFTDGDQTSVTPLIVVVDELDRCRPDYALSMLEVVKHFFSVPRVHFVLGVNLEAMEYMVRARYGADANAADYLKRFISVSMHLPEFVGNSDNQGTAVKYFEQAAQSMRLNADLIGLVGGILECALTATPISLRDIDRLLARLALFPTDKVCALRGYGTQMILMSLVFLQVVRPELYRLANKGRLTITEIDSFFGTGPDLFGDDGKKLPEAGGMAYLLRGSWSLALSAGKEPSRDLDRFNKCFDFPRSNQAKKLIPNLLQKYFGSFYVAD